MSWHAKANNHQNVDSNLRFDHNHKEYAAFRILASSHDCIDRVSLMVIHIRFRNLLVVLAFSALMAGGRPAPAVVVSVADSFPSEADRGIGAYQPGELAGGTLQNPAIPGFSGGWKNGTQATGTWRFEDVGLEAAGQWGEIGGRAAFNGFGSGIRRVYRNLGPYQPSNVYYFNGLLRLDGNADLTGANVAGFLQDKGLSDAGFFSSSSARDQEGLAWGFQGDGSEIDLVLRHRYDPDPAAGNQGQQMLYDSLVENVSVGETYSVLLKMVKDVESITTGNDRVSVWINPGDITNEAAAGAPDFEFTDFSISQTNSIQRLVFASDSFGNPVSYDEMRFGSAWGDVALRNRLVARESFESYAAPINVDTGTLNGGVGWGGPWDHTFPQATSTFSVEEPGSPLTYSTPSVSHIGGDQALRARGFGGTGSGSERAASRVFDAPESGDLYASFLVRFDGTIDTDDLFDFAFTNGNSAVGRVGVKGNAGANDGDFFAAAGTDAAFMPDLEFDTSEDHLIVSRLYKNAGSDTYNAVALWIDPEYADYNNPDLWQTASSSYDEVTGVRFFQRDLETGDFVWFDHLLVGTSWNQVVIPEPSTAVLLGFGALGLLIGPWSRRRRLFGIRA